jgi:hypothetical protein
MPRPSIPDLLLATALLAVAPAARATKVETSRVENDSGERWSIALSGARIVGPVGTVRVLKPGSNEVLATLQEQDWPFELDPDQTVLLEITPRLDNVALTLTFNRNGDPTAASAKVHVMQTHGAAAPALETRAACPGVEFENAMFGSPEGPEPWIRIMPAQP